MAKINNMNINDLTDWDLKQLRKIRMLIQNRLKVFEATEKPKEVPRSHPLFEMDPGDCKNLLKNVKRAEKNLKVT